MRNLNYQLREGDSLVANFKDFYVSPFLRKRSQMKDQTFIRAVQRDIWT